MKKTILFSLITVTTVLTVITAKAQQGLYMGAASARQLSVMFNSTDVDKPTADYQSRLGKTIGINGGYNFSNSMGIGVEVNYSRAKQRYTNNSTEFTHEYRYLKIPVMFTYNTNPDKMFIFTAKAGPQLGILLRSKIKDATADVANGSNMDQYKKLTFGMAAGAGVRMRMSSHMYLDAGLHADGTFSNTEDKKYKSYVAGRSKTHDLNGGIEVGVKYFFK